MGKRFKYLTSVKKSYVEQGKIYFLCQTYRHLTDEERKQIDALCERAGGEYAQALREFMCTQANWQAVCMEHALSSATLERIRRKFYNLW